jgi:hypothetical protein
MKIEFVSLHWDNVDQDMLDAHKRVMKHFDIPVNYYNLNINHGHWMTEIHKQSTSDIIVTIEPDCIPLNKDKLLDVVRFAKRMNTFVGIAQVSNHIRPKSHIYAAPGFYVMPTRLYKTLNCPSFSETRRSDTAEEISYIAEENGIRYRALRPTYFEGEPTEGVWPLGCLGYYGIGTVFEDTVYHLYQSRMAQNIELFVKRCDEVINGTFTTEGFHSSTTFNYKGKTVL